MQTYIIRLITAVAVFSAAFTSSHAQTYPPIVEKMKPYVMKYRACAYPFVTQLAQRSSQPVEQIIQETYVRCARQKQALADAMSNSGFFRSDDIRQVDDENEKFIVSWVAKARGTAGN